jgi:GT2 family glycosyltransferase
MSDVVPRSLSLSLIIVNYNTREFLRQCLASIQIHEPRTDVIVVDNASRDGSVAMVRAEFPHTTVVEMGCNAGFAAANNAGLEQAVGDFVVLLNSDTVLEDTSLSRCAQWMRENPKIGASSPRLIGVDDRPQQCLYAFPSLREMIRVALWMPPKNSTISLGWLAGTALVLNRQALNAIGGGLDDGFWMYWEDADLSARLLKAGWSLELFEAGHVRHYGGASGGGLDATRRADLHSWFVYGRHRWFAKHRSVATRSALIVFDLIDAVRQALRGLVKPSRRGDLIHARVTVRVLWDRLFGTKPAIPGAVKIEAQMRKKTAPEGDLLELA